jgi:hypothetical protein
MAKEFITNTTVFIILNIILLGGVNVFLSQYSHKFITEDRVLKESVRYFESAAKDVDILFAGDSTVHYGVNPDDVKISGYKVHNSGFCGEPIGTIYYKMKYYLEKGYLSSLKLVVIGVNYSNLTQDPAVAVNLDYSKYYDYVDIFKMNGFTIGIRAWINRLDIFRINPLLIKSLQKILFKKLSKSGKEELLRNGHSKREYAFLEEAFEKEKGIIVKESLSDKLPRASNLLYYKRLLALLESRHIKVVFILIPATDLLIAEQMEGVLDFDKYDLLSRKTANVLQKEFPHILLINYARPHSGWKLEYFSDAGHLNEKGAKFFGQKLSVDFSRFFIKR